MSLIKRTYFRVAEVGRWINIDEDGDGRMYDLDVVDYGSDDSQEDSEVRIRYVWDSEAEPDKVVCLEYMEEQDKKLKALRKEKRLGGFAKCKLCSSGGSNLKDCICGACQTRSMVGWANEINSLKEKQEKLEAGAASSKATIKYLEQSKVKLQLEVEDAEARPELESCLYCLLNLQDSETKKGVAVCFTCMATKFCSAESHTELTEKVADLERQLAHKAAIQRGQNRKISDLIRENEALQAELARRR